MYPKITITKLCLQQNSTNLMLKLIIHFIYDQHTWDTRDVKAAHNFNTLIPSNAWLNKKKKTEMCSLWSLKLDFCENLLLSSSFISNESRGSRKLINQMNLHRELQLGKSLFEF